LLRGETFWTGAYISSAPGGEHPRILEKEDKLTTNYRSIKYNMKSGEGKLAKKGWEGPRSLEGKKSFLP